jgi:hypothetical protein
MDIILEIEDYHSPIQISTLIDYLNESNVDDLETPTSMRNITKEGDMSGGEYIPIILTALASAKYLGKILDCVNNYVKAKHSRSVKMKFKKDDKEIDVEINNSSNSSEIVKLIIDFFNKKEV